MSETEVKIVENETEIIASPVTQEELEEAAYNYTVAANKAKRLEREFEDAKAEKVKQARDLNEMFGRSKLLAVEIKDEDDVKRRVAPKSSIWTSFVGGNKPDESVVKVLKRVHLAPLIQPTVNGQQLSAAIREKIKEYKNTLDVTQAEADAVIAKIDPELAEVLKITVKPEIQLTSKAKN